MTFNSVEEILDSIDETRQRLSQRVEGLSERQENFRAAPGLWSIAEIVEHLSLLEQRLSQMVGMMVNKAEAAAATGGSAEAKPFAPVSLDEFMERSASEKYVAPEAVTPRGGVPVADSLARLRESRAAIRALRPRIEQIDGTALLYPHPAFGPLNLYQWLALIGAHEARHLRQIETIVESPG